MENQKLDSSDEIDLGQLFIKIGNFFKGIGFGIIRFIAELRNIPIRNKTLFISLVAAGGIIGYSYSSFLKKKFYESSMILSSDYLNKRIVDNTIDKLNLLADEESSLGLAKVLNISDSLAMSIARFEAKPFVAETDLIELEVLKEQLKNAQLNSKNEKVIEQVISRIEIENRHAFELTVRTYSPTSIKPLQEALVKYFRNNDYIRKRIEISKTSLQAKKIKLEHESQKLDSLKKVIYSNYRTMAEQSRQGSNNVILSDKAVTNPIEIYTQDMQLNDQLQFVNRQLYLQPDFETVDGFTEFNEPASASRTKVVALGMLIGFALGYVLVAFRKIQLISLENRIVFFQLIEKEFTLELRRKSVVAGLGLYLFSTAFIGYLTFALKQNLITPLVWSALFWITILFTAINTVAKSFIGEKRGLEIYYYSIASPVDILLSKIIYNFLLCLLLSMTGYFLFTLFLNDPVKDKLIFIATLALVSMGFASSLTLLSGIASKANNSNILMAVLSFPVVISILLMAIKITKNCMDGLDPSVSYSPLIFLLAINCLVTAISYLLFPFIWKN